MDSWIRLNEGQIQKTEQFLKRRKDRWALEALYEERRALFSDFIRKVAWNLIAENYAYASRRRKPRCCLGIDRINWVFSRTFFLYFEAWCSRKISSRNENVLWVLRRNKRNFLQLKIEFLQFHLISFFLKWKEIARKNGDSSTREKDCF